MTVPAVAGLIFGPAVQPGFAPFLADYLKLPFLPPENYAEIIRL
jgi:hypothetical protein